MAWAFITHIFREIDVQSWNIKWPCREGDLSRRINHSLGVVRFTNFFKLMYSKIGVILFQLEFLSWIFISWSWLNFSWSGKTDFHYWMMYSKQYKFWKYYSKFYHWKHLIISTYNKEIENNVFYKFSRDNVIKKVLGRNWKKNHSFKLCKRPTRRLFPNLNNEFQCR